MKIFFLIFIFTLSALLSNADENPKVIVLTDIGGDTDDEQSLVRLLLYSDYLNIKAICATSRLGHGQDTKPELIYKQIQAYSSVYPNLLLHSSNFLSPDYLTSIVKNGQGDQFNIGDGYESEASDFIIETIDNAENTIHILIWGGQRELAQALWNVKEIRTEAEVRQFIKKIQVYAIGDQDKHRNWIINNFRNIRYIASGYMFPDNFGLREVSVYRGMYMTGNTSIQNREWVKTSIHGHGALSDCYPLDGHGTDGMKEGDSPSFLGLIQNGLNIPEKPDWGGWGGRYRLLSNHLYTDAQDFLNGTLNERHTVSRWRPSFQHDFMTRLKWCVEPFDNANHNPVIVVNGISGKQALEIKADGEEKLTFKTTGTYDPDGDSLSFCWFFYNEISNTDCMSVDYCADGSYCSIVIPPHQAGRTIHLILEVTDNGIPSLTSYKRIVIHVND